MKGITIPPREKLEQRGIEALSDVDLVAVILGSGIDGRGVMSVARSVSRMILKCLDDDQDPKGDLSWKKFVQLEGVGKVKAMQVACAVELGLRVSGNLTGGRVVIRNREDVKALCGNLKKLKQERVVVIALNARNEVLAKKTVAIGSLNKAVVEPRDIFGWVLRRGAAGIILVHNHPSGDSSPSNADDVFTEKIRDGGALLGVELIDHVII